MKHVTKFSKKPLQLPWFLLLFISTNVFEPISLYPIPMLPQLLVKSPLEKLFTGFLLSRAACPLYLALQKAKEWNKVFNILAGTEEERTKRHPGPPRFPL